MSDDESSNGASRASRAVRNISQRMKSKAESTFAPSDILPADGHQVYPKRPESDFRPSYEDRRELIFGAPPGGPMSADGSVSPPSVFDAPDGQHDQDTEPTTTRDSDEPEPYDLKPPPPTVSHDNIENLASRFFSNDHLDLIMRDPNAGPRLIQFLEQYKPQHSAALQHYIQARKAITAVDYANAVVERIPAGAGEHPYIAAALDESFDVRAKQISDDLVDEALPQYLTHRLTTAVTDILVKTITGNNIPALQDTTQYGREYVIGRNCRFLQGPHTSAATVRRMAEAIAAGDELCETIVNYRRDGTPFMNLLMLAPMYDNKGEVRYYLGCQVDVSPLIEGGRGLDSFAQLLQNDRAASRYSSNGGKGAMDLLGELGQMLDESETDFVFSRVKRSNVASRQSSARSSGQSTPVRQQSQKRPNNRRILSMDDEVPRSVNLWPDANLGRSGRLPGVYRNYLLVRPYPSLRITFTSPTLRIPGLLQTKLLDRIGGPEHLRQGLLDAFRSGTGVTAKVPWTTNLNTSSTSNNKNTSSASSPSQNQGKPRWIHCTPLCGSDERVGVWMVVLVENEEVTGLLNSREQSQNRLVYRQDSSGSGGGRRNLDVGSVDLGPVRDDREDDRESGRMYAEFLRSSKEEGRPGTTGTTESGRVREQRGVDRHFRDF